MGSRKRPRREHKVQRSSKNGRSGARENGLPRFVVDPTAEDVAAGGESDSIPSDWDEPASRGGRAVERAENGIREEESSDGGEWSEGSSVLEGGRREGRRPETTAEERRLQAAQAYLRQLGVLPRTSSASDRLSDADEVEDEDEVDARLRREALSARGQLFRAHASSPLAAGGGEHRPIFFGVGHKRPPTCVCFVTAGGPDAEPTAAITGGKDGALLWWDLRRGTKTVWCDRADKAHARNAPLLSLVASADGRLLATGGTDAVVRVYDLRAGAASSPTPVCTFRGHRDAVHGLAFFLEQQQRRGGNGGVSALSADENLFSVSADRTVRWWAIRRAPGAVKESGFVETLYGHQDGVNCVDGSAAGRLLTAGRDCTVRTWNILEDTQLVYRAPRCTGNRVHTSIDCVAWVTPQAFVSGGDDGCLSLWSTRRKKPVEVLPNAHGPSPHAWISALASPGQSDLVASGANDGAVRLWRVHMRAVESDRHRAEPLLTSLLPERLEPAGIAPYPHGGYCNALAFRDSAQGQQLFMAAAVGQEHRSGKWLVDRRARNGLAVWRW
ncbi:hypothetical protein CDCA_CDCA14G3800 [Cyanidium caldarium]|uniref:Uncharacterized protein n=1 Tax=Cyanidium caldarium TaxID=2771 RepID=A0AAV9J071_CYACA|nr:hypothetical protein CDCA_CDCA14G3800 [Cyanidium caldarium]